MACRSFVSMEKGSGSLVHVSWIVNIANVWPWLEAHLIAIMKLTSDFYCTFKRKSIKWNQWCSVGEEDAETPTSLAFKRRAKVDRQRNNKQQVEIGIICGHGWQQQRLRLPASEPDRGAAARPDQTKPICVQWRNGRSLTVSQRMSFTFIFFFFCCCLCN